MAVRTRRFRGKQLRRGAALGTVLVVPAAAFTLPHLAGASRSAADAQAQLGAFSAPFVEPTVGPGAGYPRVRTQAHCVARTEPQGGSHQPGLTQKFLDCKPTAGGMSLLPTGKVLYWDNLAGTENVEVSIAEEYGIVGLNDQSRLMDPLHRRWLKDPSPIDGGAHNANFVQPFVPGAASSEENNDGALFCSSQSFLANGDVLSNGGTKYRNDPQVPGSSSKFAGSTELEGIPNSRLYDIKTNTWKQTGPMHFGRWYPGTVTLGDGRKFVASGLRRLIKPLNTNFDPLHPGDLTQNGYSPGYGVQEGQNERETETFLPGVVDTAAKAQFTRRFGAAWVRQNFTAGKWVDNGPSGRQTLPLFPRMHLLPDGHVLYDAGGQSFSPEGQAYDEALWNLMSAYDPATRRWTTLNNGLPPGTNPQTGITSVPGFRGSTFSVMLPLIPDARGQYTRAQFLRAGGVPNPPSPGGYFAVRDSDIRTVDSAAGQDRLVSIKSTGMMLPSLTHDGVAEPFGRWYATGTLLPDGEVLATNGADRDEVVSPGDEIDQRQAQLFDPATGTWRGVAFANHGRTYHNTAALLPDGRVLVGGHAVISNNYLANRNTVPGQTAPNQEARDPTFEIYSPPYMFLPGRQARVTAATQSCHSRRTMLVSVSVPARQIANVRLVRNTSLTHIVDADQRTVQLRIIARRGNQLAVAEPPSGNVTPPGPYMLFANQLVAGNKVKPAVALQVMVATGGHVSLRRACAVRRPPRIHRHPHTHRHPPRPPVSEEEPAVSREQMARAVNTTGLAR